MSTNITPHLFITTSYDLINRMYYGINKSFSSLLDNLTEEELKSTILVSQKYNNNLIRFEHSFGYEGNNVSQMEIELLDVDGGLNSILSNLSFYPLIYRKLYNSAKINADKTSTKDLESLFSASALTQAQLDFYFAYGISDNMSEWAGPYHSVLSNVEQIFTSEGIRSIKITFSTTPSSFFLNYLAEKEKSSLSKKVDRFSNLYLHGEGPEVSESRIIDLDEIDNPHSFLINIVSSYLKRVVNSNNVLVFLPSISKIIEANIKEVNDSLIKNDITFANPLAWEIRKKGNSIKSTNIRKVLRTLGFSISNYFGGFEKYVLPVYEQRVESSFGLSENEEFLTSVNIKSNLLLSREYLKENYTMYTDYFIPLKKIENGYYELDPTTPKKFIYYEENDIRILNILHKFGIIPEKNKSVHIFGEENLIDFLLYLDTKIITEINKDVDDVINLVNEKNNITNIADTSDIEKFGTSYRKEFFNTFYKNAISNTYYRNVEANEDELRFIGIDPNKNIAETTPVFRCNLPNGNVTGFKSDIDVNGMFAYMNGIRLRTDSELSTSVEAIAKELLRRSISKEYYNEVISYISTFISDRNKIKGVPWADIYTVLLNNLETKFNPNELDKSLWRLPSSNHNVDAQKVAKIVVKLLYLDAKYNNGQSVVISDDNGSKASYIHNKILNYMYGYISNINIRTVPMFNLGSLAIRRLHTLFLMGRNKVAGSTNLSPDLLGYSGRYFIFGFKHTITNNEMYSEFELTKNPVKNQEIPDVVDSELDSILSDREIDIGIEMQIKRENEYNAIKDKRQAGGVVQDIFYRTGG